MHRTIYTILQYDMIHTIPTSISYNSLTLPICPYHTKFFFTWYNMYNIDNCASINHLILSIYYMELNNPLYFDWTQRQRLLKTVKFIGYVVIHDMFKFFFFFFLESFNLWHPLLIIAIYYQTKTLMCFNV